MPANDQLTDLLCHVADDKVVRLGDIPGTDWEPLARELDTNWVVLSAAPCSTATIAQAVFDFCCRRANVEPRQLGTNELWAAFEKVEDDRPKLYHEGLPVPKAEDEKTMETSSSSTSETDGPPT